MDLNRLKLIQKVMQSGVTLTPYEAIHLKYLMKRGLLDEAIRLAKSDDVYRDVENIRSGLTPTMANFIIRQAAEASPEEYEDLDFAYENMLRQDEGSAKNGYCGLMLLTQLRLTRAEFNRRHPRKSLLDFDSYSYYHQDIKTFNEVLGSLGENFKFLIMDIDNILTLNYFLNKLIELDDLVCLKHLKMWLSKPRSNYDEDFEFMNGAYLCCSSEIINIILDQNHQSFVNNIEGDLGGLPTDFAESSLRYVKEVLNGIIPKEKL